MSSPPTIPQGTSVGIMGVVSRSDSIMLLNTRFKSGRINAEVTTDVANRFEDHHLTRPPTTNDDAPVVSGDTANL